MLTARQAEVLAFIKSCIAQGAPPTVREICRQFGITNVNGAQCHLRALREKGKITWKPGKSRTIRLVGANRCPMCGRTA